MRACALCMRLRPLAGPALCTGRRGGAGPLRCDRARGPVGRRIGAGPALAWEAQGQPQPRPLSRRRCGAPGLRPWDAQLPPPASGEGAERPRGLPHADVAFIFGAGCGLLRGYSPRRPCDPYRRLVSSARVGFDTGPLAVVECAPPVWRSSWGDVGARGSQVAARAVRERGRMCMRAPSHLVCERRQTNVASGDGEGKCAQGSWRRFMARRLPGASSAAKFFFGSTPLVRASRAARSAR